MDSSWLESVIAKHEWKNEPAKILDFECESLSAKGGNFLSTIFRVKVTLMLKSGSKIKKNFILKKALDDESGVDEFYKKFTPFKMEIMMFETVLSHMERLMDEFNDKNELLWGKCYGSNPFDLMLFEDLTQSSYAVNFRKDCLSLDQGLLVLRNAGRYHAMSKILLERGLATKNDFPDHFLYSDSETWEKIFGGGLKMLSQTISASWPAEYQSAAQKIAALSKVVTENLIALSKVPEEETFYVINHGDMWSNNLMFKNADDNKKPISVKFVDFQVPHINSYLYDVLYFTYTSMKPEVRRAHLEELFETYHKSFTSNLKFFGYTKKIPDFNDMKAEAKRLGLVGFLMCTLIHGILIAEGDNSFSLENPFEVDGEMQFLHPSVFQSENYRNHVQKDILDFEKQGVF